MFNLNIGDKVSTVDCFPTIGIIEGFGYIPLDCNKKAFVRTDKNQLLAIDLSFAAIEILAPKSKSNTDEA